MYKYKFNPLISSIYQFSDLLGKFDGYGKVQKPLRRSIYTKNRTPVKKKNESESSISSLKNSTPYVIRYFYTYNKID